MVEEPKVLCKTPTPGKKGTRILKWKYDLIRSTILAVVPSDEVGILFKDLPRLVQGLLTEADLKRLGSLGWYTTTVKLDLEVRSEIERIPGVKPQRLRRSH
ncbi:MAG: hypothetical protein AMJ88_10050 [Anaerolineae bacterium SM23_ 63]|nr:MAG: hypothetical protein AMJ88_10050 [Anaerolineae bacterium SM23_ 63]